MNKLSRLRWRCRRGIKEMDMVLQRFLEHDYALLDDRQKLLFDRMLDETDLDLLDWLLGRSRPRNSDYEELLQRFRQAEGG